MSSSAATKATLKLGVGNFFVLFSDIRTEVLLGSRDVLPLEKFERNSQTAEGKITFGNKISFEMAFNILK